MTIAQVLESLMGKTGFLDGKIKDSTPFTSSSTDIVEKACADMKALGFNAMGTETMCNGYTGKPMKAQIYIGGVYYQRLKHMVADKCHSRSHGPIQQLTHQPLKETWHPLYWFKDIPAKNKWNWLTYLYHSIKVNTRYIDLVKSIVLDQRYL